MYRCTYVCVCVSVFLRENALAPAAFYMESDETSCCTWLSFELLARASGTAPDSSIKCTNTITTSSSGSSTLPHKTPHTHTHTHTQKHTCMLGSCTPILSGMVVHLFIEYARASCCTRYVCVCVCLCFCMSVFAYITTVQACTGAAVQKLLLSIEKRISHNAYACSLFAVVGWLFG